MSSRTGQYFIIVSIPHRYAKNGVDNYRIDYDEQFQFLIGTLKT